MHVDIRQHVQAATTVYIIHDFKSSASKSVQQVYIDNMLFSFNFLDITE